MTAYQAREGITAVCPTTLTLSEEALTGACREIARAAAESDPNAAAIVGINLEGPFVSPDKLGAHASGTEATLTIGAVCPSPSGCTIASRSGKY